MLRLAVPENSMHRSYPVPAVHARITISHNFKTAKMPLSINQSINQLQGINQEFLQVKT